MFSLESPHRGDSNEYTQHTIFNMKRKKTLIILSLSLWDFSKGLKNEFETAVVNESSVFEPLKFYCSCSGCPATFNILEVYEYVFICSFKVSEYTFKRANSFIYILPSLPNRDISNSLLFTSLALFRLFLKFLF